MFLDDRSGPAITYSFEIQTDNLVQAGKNEDGIDRFLYFSKSPRLVKKITTRYLATTAGVSAKIAEMSAGYDRAVEAGAPSGIFIESVSGGGGLIIIEGQVYFSVTVTEADYTDGGLGAPPDTFAVTESQSASVSPAGYMPDSLKAYFSNGVTGITTTVNCTTTQDTCPGGGGILTAVSMSNMRYIGGKLFRDVSSTYSERNASIKLT